MLGALITTATATALTLAATVPTVLTGCLRRFTALFGRGLEASLRHGGTPRLSPRDRSELVARLWVP